MNIERLRKSHKKQIVIGAVAICVVGGALTFNLTRAKYKLTESISLVRGTVNYKVPDLRTVALYTANDSGTYVETNDIPTSGYQLNKTKSVCKVYDGSTSVENAPVDSSITIEYRGGKVTFANLTKRNTRCYLYFDKQTTITMDYLIDSLPIKIGSPNFSKVATTDEGIYQASDGMYGGVSYYWRGASTTNHVIFANKCWRIVRINGDKSMRLIYNGTVKENNTCTGNGANVNAIIMGSSNAEKYYATSDGQYNNSSYVGWTYSLGSQRTTSGTASNAKTRTEAWYSSNIGNYANKVADGKYCNDRNTGQPLTNDSGYVTSWSATETKFRYAGVKRLWEDYQPTLSCATGDIYTLKVGLITADEVEFAGGKNENNTSYYMYTDQNYWTMSPYYWYGYAGVFFVQSNGYLSGADVDSTGAGLRPVINLRSDITFSSGNGTQSKPYIVS